MVFGKKKRAATDEDADAVGKVVDVIEAVGPGDKEGRIKFGGTTWRARCPEVEIPTGAKAMLIYREDQVWIIDPYDPSIDD